MEERPETIETEYKVRFPKGLMLFMSITSAVVGGGIFIFLFILSVIRLIHPLYPGKSETYGYITLMGISLVFLAIFVFAMIYPIWRYKCVIDIYKKDRFIRMYGKKVKYEIEYKKIVSMKEGLFYTLYIICDGPIIPKGKKNGPRTLIGYYKKEERYRVKQIVGDCNYNLIT